MRLTRATHATGTDSSGTKYYHGDSLGSERLMTSAVPDASGNFVVPDSDATYLPFGAEWNAPATPPTHYQFTGKERDAETQNDYFGARYYNSSMGRWLSPDWSAAPEPIPYADMSDPQSLNLYGYVRNRPTFATDKDGHCFSGPAIVICVGGAAVITFVGVAMLETPQGKQSTQSVIEGLITLGGKLINGTNSLHDNVPGVIQSSEQGRDAQGKFLPKQPGQTRPGAEAEQKGLDAVGADKNTKPVPGTSRINDGKVRETGQNAEVKSGEVVSNTEQIREMGAGSKAATGLPLLVVTTNPNVKVTKPAQENKDLEIKPIPKND